MLHVHELLHYFADLLALLLVFLLEFLELVAKLQGVGLHRGHLRQVALVDFLELLDLLHELHIRLDELLLFLHSFEHLLLVHLLFIPFLLAQLLEVRDVQRDR